MDNSHFILLHSALKLKTFFSVRKAIFRNPFFLFSVSFCLLGKILLVSRIQTAFARRKRSGYRRLDKMDFQRPVLAVKKCFRLVPCPENIIVHERSLLMPHAFAIRLFFPKRKPFADIHGNVGLVRSVMIRQRSSNCKNPIITPSGA